MRKEMPSCNVQAALMIIGSKWDVLIVYHLLSGTRRFCELKNDIGTITQKVLTSSLRALAEDGVVIRHDYGCVPPKVDYTLTEEGYQLAGAIKELSIWGESYKKNH